MLNTCDVRIWNPDGTTLPDKVKTLAKELLTVELQEEVGGKLIHLHEKLWILRFVNEVAKTADGLILRYSNQDCNYRFWALYISKDGKWINFWTEQTFEEAHLNVLEDVMKLRKVITSEDGIKLFKETIIDLQRELDVYVTPKNIPITKIPDKSTDIDMMIVNDDSIIGNFKIDDAEEGGKESSKSVLLRSEKSNSN